MKETFTVGLDIYLLGLIAFLLVSIMFMLRKVIGLLTSFQDRLSQTAIPKAVGYDHPASTTECTDEELAVITAVLAQLIPDQKMNIVNLKLIQ